MKGPVNVVVEGPTDKDVATRILEECGIILGRFHGLKGRQSIERGITGFNNAAKHQAWFVLVDLDKDTCAGGLCRSWLENPNPLMCIRIAVREIESWLLADSERLSIFLKVSHALVPESPETLPDPKQALVNLARRSRSTKIRHGLVPREKSGRVVGELYTSMISEFILDTETGWRPDVAAQYAPSLDRCMKALRSRFTG